MLIDKIPARRYYWTWRPTQQTAKSMHWAHQRQRQRSTAANGRIGQCHIIALSPTRPGVNEPCRARISVEDQRARDRLRCTGGACWLRAGRDDDYTNETNNNNEAQAAAQARKVLTLLRELPALVEFLEAKAHMAHAASLHQPTRKRHPRIHARIHASMRYPPASHAC